MKPKIYLSKTELAQLQNKEIGNKRLDEVRDCFVFCCYTGLAFKEMSNLRKEHIVKGKDSKNWIRLKRQKTNKNISVPLLPMAQKILDKYRGQLTVGKVFAFQNKCPFQCLLEGNSRLM